MKKKLFYKFQTRKIGFNFKFSKVELEKNHYEILQVPFTSDSEAIKSSYYKLAKQYHPDLNPETNAIEMFKKIKKAYEVLGDPNQRVAYDIEHNFTEELKDSEFNERYNLKSNKRIIKGPRTIKNIYFNKWNTFNFAYLLNYFCCDYADFSFVMGFS